METLLVMDYAMMQKYISTLLVRHGASRTDIVQQDKLYRRRTNVAWQHRPYMTDGVDLDMTVGKHPTQLC